MDDGADNERVAASLVAGIRRAVQTDTVTAANRLLDQRRG